MSTPEQPAALGAVPGTTSPTATPDSLRSTASVLVVDDHPANLIAIESILAPLGLKLVMAGSGEEALRQLLRGEFALILLDVQMPVLDGLATAAIIKKAERTKHIPIVFLTAFGADQDQISRAYRAGAADYLLKPFEPHALRAKVQVFVDLYLAVDNLKRRASQVAEAARLDAQELIARAEAEAAIRAREEVVRRLSHDLRTPLASIVSATELALRDVGDQSSPRRKLELVLLAAARMDRHLDDLLDLTRLEAGRLTLERELRPAARLVAAAAEAAREEAARRNAQIEVDDTTDGQLVPCDEPRILRVLATLLQDATRRADDGGVILVRAAVQAGHVVLTIVDAGKGIPADERDRYFSDAWQRRTGSGLGLALGCGIVEAHGGRLTVGAGPDGGSAMTLALPI